MGSRPIGMIYFILKKLYIFFKRGNNPLFSLLYTLSLPSKSTHGISARVAFHFFNSHRYQ